jgi:hypothetical protein
MNLALKFQVISFEILDISLKPCIGVHEHIISKGQSYQTNLVKSVILDIGTFLELQLEFCYDSVIQETRHFKLSNHIWKLDIN